MVVVLILLSISATVLFTLGNPEKPLQYNQVIDYFRNGEVAEYTLDFTTGELTVVFTKEAVEQQTGPQMPKVEYKVPDISLFIHDTHDIVAEQNAKTPGSVAQYFIPPKDQTFITMWGPVLVILVIVGAFWFIMLRQSRGASGIGFTKVKHRAMEDGRRVNFDDVAGADEEKEELVEIVEFLKNPRKYNEIGARIPKGVLLVGPPGTGKTLLARAVAGEAGVPFFSISGSDFVEMYVGVGASRVRDLFDQAKKASPSIVFIDEIDAVGRHRGAGLGGGHDEREQTLNQLLVEMDGFGSNTGVIIIAATNRKDILDPALLRPGRFDRQVVVNYPDIKGREEILKVHARGKPLGPDVTLATIAKTTSGFTGADLENLLNEAALLAAKRGYRAITMAEIEEATIKVLVGPEKRSAATNEKKRRLTAYHEAGHAICSYFCETQDRVHQISIVPRGWMGGFTLSLPEEDKSFVTKKEMSENIITLLGGRVAEQLILDDISTGASNDIERATATARNMVTKYGFSEKLGPIVYGRDHSEVFLGRDFVQGNDYSESVAGEIDGEIRQIIDTSYAKALEILDGHRDQLHMVAGYLLENEKLDGDAFEKLMQGEDAATVAAFQEAQKKKAMAERPLPIPEEPKEPPAPTKNPDVIVP